MTGTLDKTDSGDRTVNVGDDKQFECDLIPLDAAGRLDGVWTARVFGDEADIVSVDVANGRAVVRPRNASSGDANPVYSKPGQVVVECVFTGRDGVPIYQFNRTVTVKRECTLWFQS